MGGFALSKGSCKIQKQIDNDKDLLLYILLYKEKRVRAAICGRICFGVSTGRARTMRAEQNVHYKAHTSIQYP